MGIGLCMFVAGNKIYSFYKSHQPIVAEGECLEITDTQLGTLKILIVKNNNLKGESEDEADYEFFSNVKITAPIKVSYEELRHYNAHKVVCE